MRHEKLPNYATYLVLNGSYSNVFWRSIGYVGIRNNSSKGYTFAAWPMYSVIPTGYNPTLYEIKVRPHDLPFYPPSDNSFHAFPPLKETGGSFTMALFLISLSSQKQNVISIFEVIGV